jgi:Chaperone of endosialidase
MSLSAPSVPTYDPYSLANSQAQANVTSSIASQLGSEVGQQTPFGSLSYQQTGSYTDPTTGQVIPLTSATTQLSPAEQQLLTTGQGTQQTAATGAQNVLSGAGYGTSASPTVAGAGTNANTASGQVSGLLANSGYGSGATPNLMSLSSGLTGQEVSAETGYLQPFFTQQTTQLDTQLRNQGLDPSSPAYQQAMNNLQQSQNQSVSGFVAQAAPQAFAEAEQQYELPATTASALESGVVAPSYGQSTTGYELPLQTAASLYSVGAPASLSSSLINTPTENVQAPNYASDVTAANQAAIANAQLQQQQYSGMLSGLSNLGSAGILAFGLSDEEAKENIHQVGELYDATPVYLFNYKSDPTDSPQMGVMAQDVEKIRPDAVTPRQGDGYKYVDYAKATERSRHIADMLRALSAAA